MKINEEKMKIVINNYFKAECNIDTSIREAFEKGFRIGAKKASIAVAPKWVPCSVKKHPDKSMYCHVTVIDEDGDCIVDNDDWNVDYESWNEYLDDEIIAWMPEITPYQPKEDES